MTGVRLGVLVLVATAGPAAADEYTDPSGFTLTYPAGWVAVNRQLAGQVTAALPPETRAWLDRNNVTLDQVSVLVFRPGAGDFSPNLNVVVVPQAIPADPAAAAELVAALPRQYEALGAKLEDPHGTARPVGGRPAVVVDYHTRLPGIPHRLRQRQVYLPAGGRTYILTATAPADQFAAHEAAFDEMASGFAPPAGATPPAVRGFDWSRVATMRIVGGVVGGLVAAVGGVLARRRTGRT